MTKLVIVLATIAVGIIHVCRTMTCICSGCSALPPRFSEFIYLCIVTSKNTLINFSYIRIKTNNLCNVGGICLDIEDLVWTLY